MSYLDRGGNYSMSLAEFQASNSAKRLALVRWNSMASVGIAFKFQICHPWSVSTDRRETQPWVKI